MQGDWHGGITGNSADTLPTILNTKLPMVIPNPPVSRDPNPRISANQLGEFVFASPSRKLRILTDQKYGNIITSPYYQPALDTLLHAFDDGRFDREYILESQAKLRVREARTRNARARWENNIAMLARFVEIEQYARPVTGQHQVVRQNALMELGNVTVSVRPEIVTRRPEQGLFSFTKLRFSKSKVSEDASEVILLILLKYGQRLSQDGWQLDPEATRLVDCYSRVIIPGHTIPRIREHQLTGALKEIEFMWPRIPPPLERAEHTS